MLMKDGFIRVAAGSFKVSIANVKKNAQEIIRLSKSYTGSCIK